MSILVTLVFEHRFELLAQFGRVFVPMRGNRMLHRRLEHFIVGARNFERAILLTRVIPAID